MLKIKGVPLLWLSAIAIATLPAACTVGPNYNGPPDAAPLSKAAGHFHRADTVTTSPAPPAARWWDALGDAELSRLVDIALANSPTVRQALDKVRSARASLDQSKTALLPTGGASALALKAHVPTSSQSSLAGTGAAGAQPSGQSTSKSNTISLYSVGFDASWELDLFGGTRRAIEASAAQADAQQAQFEDSQVQLAAEVAQAYVNLRQSQALLTLAKQALVLQQNIYQSTQRLRGRGVAANSDIERAVTGVAQAKGNIAPQQAAVYQYLDQLAMLTGREPGALDAELVTPAPIPLPPAQVAVGDPAAMLRRRPDIRAAERQLAAGTATIGKNVAQFFPQVSLLGDIGFSSNTPGNLFKGDSLVAFGLPRLSWNVLNFPKIAAQVRGAKADRDADADNYVATVLSALQDAEASLSRYGGQRESLLQLAGAQASAVRASASTTRLFQGGVASLTDVMNTQSQQIQAENSFVQGQAGLTNDYIALQKSLGLGWADIPFKASQGVQH